MISVESPLRIAVVVLGVLSAISFFAVPAASFLALVFGVLTIAITLSESRIAVLVPLLQIVVCLASLYYLGEALIYESPSSLVTGVALSLVSILMMYLESKLLILRTAVGKAGVVVVAAVFATLLYTYRASIPAVSSFMEEDLYGIIELIAYSGLLYIGASLPYSSVILFGLVYLVYDLLRSIRPKEVVQPTQEARQV
ncbi:MAG: hypothetical protein QW741_02640 [Sulfolobales archaeon]